MTVPSATGLFNEPHRGLSLVMWNSLANAYHIIIYNYIAYKCMRDKHYLFFLAYRSCKRFDASTCY